MLYYISCRLYCIAIVDKAQSLKYHRSLDRLDNDVGKVLQSSKEQTYFAFIVYADEFTMMSVTRAHRR